MDHFGYKNANFITFSNEVKRLFPVDTVVCLII